MGHRQIHVMQVIEKAESLVKMGLGWFEATRVALKGQGFYKEEILHVANYMKHFYGENQCQNGKMAK